MKSKTYYYQDELNDDFAGVIKKEITIGDDYKYIHNNIFYRIGKFFVYRIIMTPVAFFHMKIKFHHKIENKKVIKKYKKKGFFLYANHTLFAGDAYTPSLCAFPKEVYVVVNKDNISSKGTKTWICMSGALPIPSTLKGMKNFNQSIDILIKKKKVIQIYPEAHIWPYYTGIRPFSSVSFRYPCKDNAPVFCFTNTFTKQRFSKRPKITTYIDGPFIPDEKLDLKERQEKLRNEVFECMKSRSELSTYSINEYIRKDGELDD